MQDIGFGLNSNAAVYYVPDRRIHKFHTRKSEAYQYGRFFLLRDHIFASEDSSNNISLISWAIRIHSAFITERGASFAVSTTECACVDKDDVKRYRKDKDAVAKVILNHNKKVGEHNKKVVDKSKIISYY